MTQTVEFDLAKVLERLEQKLDRVIESQIRLEGKVETLHVEVQNLKKGQDDLKTELKETRNDVSGLYKWFTATLITAGIGAGTILLRLFDLFPKS